MSTADSSPMLSPTGIAGKAWGSFFQALRRMPLTILVTLILFSVAQFHVIDHFAAASLPPGFAGDYSVSFLGLVVEAIPATVLGVAISRLVLLGDHRLTSTLPLMAQYFVWLSLLRLAEVAPSLLQSHIGQIWAAILAVIAGFVFILVTVRLSLFFPAIAVGSRSASLSESWRMTRGNFWRIFWSGFAAIVPCALVVFAVRGVFAAEHIVEFRTLPQRELAPWPLIALNAPIAMIACALLAAVDAWIYQALSRR